MSSCDEIDTSIQQVLESFKQGEYIDFPLDLTIDVYNQEELNKVLDAAVTHPEVYAQIWHTNETISDHEAEQLAKLIRTSRTLKILLIFGKVSDENSLKLVSALKDNRTLNCLRIDETSSLISDEVFAQFKDVTLEEDVESGWKLIRARNRNATYFERYPRVEY